MLKLASTVTLWQPHEVQVGGDVRWQNGVFYVGQGVTTADGEFGVVRQPSYVVLDLTASALLVEHLHAYLNVRNPADRRYLASLMWVQAYYAAPRSVTLSVAYKF